jgi:hypothetical protein
LFPDRAKSALLLAWAAAALWLCLPLGLAAQSPAAAAPSEGGGLQASVGAQSEFNSNINENNAAPLAGWEQEIFADLGLRRTHATHALAFDYRPYLQLYDADPALNSLNQIGEVRASADLGPRWALTAAGSGGYLEELPANTITGLQPILSSTTYTVVPRAREETGNAQLGVSYLISPRLTLQATAAASALRFPGAATTGVLNRLAGTETTVSLQLAATSRTSVGVRYSYQNFSVGAGSHLAADGLRLTWAHAFTSLTRVQAYGGAEYSQAHDTWVLQVGGAALTARMYRVRTYPAFGALAAHAGDAWRWTAQADHRIGNGGGALPFPVSLWDARATLSPQLADRWRLSLGVHASRMAALSAGILASNLSMLAGGFQVTRPIGPHLTAGFDANYLAQSASGALVLAPGVGRFVGGVRLLWQWPASAEGEN